jgi:hypothetical protein
VKRMGLMGVGRIMFIIVSLLLLLLLRSPGGVRFEGGMSVVAVAGGVKGMNGGTSEPYLNPTPAPGMEGGAEGGLTCWSPFTQEVRCTETRLFIPSSTPSNLER